MANYYYYSRDYNRAVNELKKAVELYPNFGFTHLYLSFTYSQLDMQEEAIKSMQKVNTLSDSPRNLAYLGYIYSLSGNDDKAFQILDSLLTLSNQKLIRHAYAIAVLYIGLEDYDQALYWLEKSYENHEYDINFIKVEPIFNLLYDNPRFVELLKKMGLD